MVEAGFDAGFQLYFHSIDEFLGFPSLPCFCLLRRVILQLLDILLRRVLSLKIGIWVPPLVMLTKKVLTREHSATMAALDSPRHVVWVQRHFLQILQGVDRLVQHFILFRQFLHLALVAQYLFLVGFTFLVGRFVLHVNGLREAFKVVLGVGQVLDRHLRKPEHLHEVVQETFNVVSGHVRVGDVLEQCLECFEVYLRLDLRYVCCKDGLPFDGFAPLFEPEFWRHWYSEAFVDCCGEEILSRILDARKLQTILYIHLAGVKSSSFSHVLHHHLFHSDSVEDNEFLADLFGIDYGVIIFKFKKWSQ